MKIVTIVGARPQFIKAATLSRVARNHSGIREILVHTGQHYDENMSEVFFRQLDIPVPDYNLGTGSGSHAVQTGAMMTGIEKVLLNEKPDRVLVYGDTNSTLAGALTAAKLHIPVAHVEAGLRSFNRRMPEEINRILTDHVAELLFAPTETAMRNLANEGLETASRFTGDVMFDSVLFYRDMVTADPGRYRIAGLPDSYMLATVHRAENTDNPEILSGILDAFWQTGRPIVLPLHPRTRKMLENSAAVPANVKIIDPVGYLQMLRLTLDSEKVLTDSGGLQKEAYFLEKPCITLRTETEWVETVHDQWNTVTGTDPERILAAVALPHPQAPQKPSFGNGRAASEILSLLTGF